MSDILNDGGVIAGSRDLTINAIVYATDDFKIDTDSRKIVRTDKNDIPTGRKFARGETTGTATLQLASGTTVLPPLFGQFTTAVDVGTNGIFTVSKVGKAETKGGETKVPISFELNITTNIVAS